MPDAAERYSSEPVITLDGQPLSESYLAALTSVRVDQSVHLPDAFTLRFDDPDFRLLDELKFKPGSKVNVGFRTARGTVVLTHGEVTALAVEQGTTMRHEMVISGMDATHRLARQATTRSYQQMTDADIVDRIARDYGLDTEIDPTQQVHDYVLQSSETDLAFLRKRASLLGFDLWIAENKLYFKRSPTSGTTPPTLRWRENLTRFKVRFSSTERCDEVTVRAWDPVAKQAIVGSAQTGDTGTTAPLAAEFSSAAQQGFGTVKRFAGQVPVQTQAEADALASSLLLKASGEEVIARGEALGDPRVSAGATVTIEGMGSRLSGDYRITSAEHIYATSSPYITRFVCGGKEPSSVVDLLGGGGGSGMKRGWGSLVVGVVTNNDDPEKLGRVRVKFPSLSDGDESAWARTVMAGGGANRGMCLLPEVGDEVLVGFEHDKKERPIVLGGLWNRDDPPPKELRDSSGVRYRTWTSRNGHVIEIDDDDSAPSITLSLNGGDTQLVIKKGETVLKDPQSVKFEGQQMAFEGQSVEIKASGSLKLSAPSIEVSADGTLTLKGSLVQIN